MEKSKKEILTVIVLCISIIVLTTAITYAYFVSQIGTNEPEQVTITSGALSLTFRDNDETVKNIEGTWNFGDTIEKELVIENTGTKDAYAKISWDNLINTYLEESLTYTLEEKRDDDGSEYEKIASMKNVPRSETASTLTLADSLEVPAGHTYTYRLRITFADLPDIDQTVDLNATFVTKFTLDEGQKPIDILAKSNDASITTYSAGNTGEMYVFDHEATSQTSGWSISERRDYRYTGANPNNWIKFNDEDWRIIGVFTVETAKGTKEQLIKIIRNGSIGEIMWDSSNENEWPSSSLKTLLNSGDYYNRANTYVSTGLNETARNQIEEVKWYLGGSNTSTGLGGPAYYSFERGTTTCVTTGKCSGQMRSVNTIAKVGLIYPSDYLYTHAYGVYDACFNGSNSCSDFGYFGKMGISHCWWTIFPFVESSSGVYTIGVDGQIIYDCCSSNSYHVLPTVYLKSNIKIVSGDGKSSETAYQIL